MKEIVSFAVFISFLILIGFNKNHLLNFSLEKTNVILMLSFSVVWISAYLLLSYLKLDASGSKNINEIRRDLERLKILQEYLAEDKREEIVNLLVSKIESQSNDEIINKILKNKKENDLMSMFEQKYEFLILDLTNIISVQNNKANVNLLLGIISAVSGVTFLAFSFVAIDFSLDIPLSVFAMNFLPKLSIVLIIETLSFFFLKLYKKSLDEVKYFSNQLTGIRLRLLSFETALLLEDKELIKENILNLMTSQVSENTNEKYDFRSSIDELSKLVKAIGNKTD